MYVYLSLRQRPLLVVGLLQLPSPGSEAQTLELRDSTGIYLQFSLDHVTVLSPSVSMAMRLRQGAGPGEEEAESEEPDRKKPKAAAEEGGGVRACVSVVIRAEQKEGVAWRNVGAGSTLSFSLRAAVIGPVVWWGRDPKNRPITEREVTPGEKKTLSLSFCGSSARWFPLLQDGRYYRLVAVDTQDPSVLIGRAAVAGQKGVELHADSALQVHSDWRIHTVPPPPRLGPRVTSDLVSFQALVLDRTGVSDRNSAQTGARLTVCDVSGRSLQVYLELGHAPFSPACCLETPSDSVYCCSVPVSCVSVVSVGQSPAPAPPPFPMMLLGQWDRGGGVSVARVKGHLVCVLFLQLQWSCSKCDRVFTRVRPETGLELD
ncbi:hypothetical protein WMY93_033817 [Mugilogobius chulae]|uniref:Uncharacterized protein n=1 Tax=Mugilogobius chulae TaxID=88201 RepID=A0AAW0MJ47_9GOBI